MVAPMTDKTFLPDVWRELCRSQPWWAELAQGWNWFGLDPKTFPDRLKVLSDAKSLAKARSLLAPFNKEDLEHLERLAEVNRRQAGIVARRTLITNISAPLALALGVAQIFPEWAKQLLEQPYGIEEAILVVVIASIFASVQYAQIQAKQAENLHDLITCRLSAARHEEATLTAESDHEIASPAAPAATVATP